MAGSDNWYHYQIMSHQYNNPYTWHQIRSDSTEPTDLAALATKIVFSYGFGEYFLDGPKKWHHHCTPAAKFELTSPVSTVYFHDIDNALIYAGKEVGTLFPVGDAAVSGSDAWTINQDMTLDLSKTTSDSWELDKDIIVPVGKKLTVKGGELDLKGNHFDVQGSLVIAEGAVVEAGAPSDSWAIETSGINAKVVIDGQLNANANGIKAEKGANVTIGANGVLDAADEGILAAKYTTVTVNGALEAGEIGIKATDATVNVKGELFAGVNGIEALGNSKVTVDGMVSALRTGIVADGCSQVDINKGSIVVSIRGIDGDASQLADIVGEDVKGKIQSLIVKGMVHELIEKDNLLSIAAVNYVGVGIKNNAKVNIAEGTVMGKIGVLQDGVGSVLNITGGIIAGFNNAIVVNNGFFNINAKEDTLIISENGDTIVLNKGTIVPSITAAEGVGLVVATEGDGSQAVVVNPEGAFFKGGFISAGFYSTNVNDKYIKTGFQDVKRTESGMWEVVPCTTITDKSVSLSTYVVNFVNGNTPKPEVTVKIGGKIVDPRDYDVKYEYDQSVGKAKVTVTATGDNYKGTVVKYYYVKGPVTPGTVLDPDQQGHYTVKVIGNHFVYNGQPIKPLVTVKFGSLYVNPLDYIVTYDKNVNAGTATVKVTSRANVEVKAQDVTTAPKFYGEAEFKIEKRNLYIIPNSYTKSLDGKALNFDASAYGYILKDANAVKGFISNLGYKLLDKDGTIVVDTGLDSADLFKTGGVLRPGSYQIVAIAQGAALGEDVNPIDNYNIIISAKGKLVILDANGKAPVVDFNGTGNSLLDMINKSIQKAAGTLGDTIKDTVVQPVKVISQLEKAVERAQNLWLSLNKGLHPVGCHCAVCTIC